MNSDEMRRDRSIQIKLGRAGGKEIRLDRPADFRPESDAAGSLAPEGPGLMKLILKAIRADPSNRRGTRRHAVIEHEVWVGWWTNDSFGAINGRLINISLGGALVVLAHRPPRKKAVWIYKETGPSLTSIHGEVAGHTPAPGGQFAVRLRFASPCPTALSQAVVCGKPVSKP